MPLYAFECPACGPFDVHRPMVAASDPLACSSCGAPAVRRYTAPASATRSSAARADAVDERSRHAPERVVRPGGGHGHDHGRHGHDHGAKGAHHSPGRPWQISH